MVEMLKAKGCNVRNEYHLADLLVKVKIFELDEDWNHEIAYDHLSLFEVAKFSDGHKEWTKVFVKKEGQELIMSLIPLFNYLIEISMGEFKIATELDALEV